MENQNRLHNETTEQNETLYINNINEKIKLEELKLTLFNLFSPFGEILDIQAGKRLKMKGQAFVIYKDINSAVNAKNFLSGFVLYGKSIQVNFAKSKSDHVLKLNGELTTEEENERKEKRKANKDKEYEDMFAQPKIVTHKKTTLLIPSDDITAITNQQGMELTPNNILFIENLTNDITEQLLRSVFSKYSGFKEVRYFQGRGIAFVEYDTEINAGGALLGLNNMRLTGDCELNITFAKK